MNKKTVFGLLAAFLIISVPVMPFTNFRSDIRTLKTCARPFDS